VRSNMLLIGGSIPAMANVLFFVLIFFSLREIAFIQYLSVRLELGSRLFFKCIIFNSNCIDAKC
jgi:hypothetical protein